MFDSHMNYCRMIGLPCGEETMTIRQAVFVPKRNGRTDTDRIAISISRVSLLTTDKNDEV